MLSIMHAYYTIFRVKSEEKSSIFSGGTPLAFSDGSTKVYLIYNQHNFSRDKSPTNEYECDFVWSLIGENKRKSVIFRTCFENEQSAVFA